MSLAIANRYARALVDVVLDPSMGVDPQKAAEQLRAMEELVADSPELRSVLLSPAVPPARKRAVVTRLAEPLSVSRVVRNFILVAIDRRRISLLGEIRRAFESLLDERLGIVRAAISSARELTAPQRDKLGEELSRMTGKKVRGEFTLDEALLGGAVVRVGSRILDGSVRGRLETLRQRLVK